MKKNDKIVYLVLGVILVFGLLLRVYALGVPVMWFDETITGLTAQDITEKGIPMYDSGFTIGSTFVFHYLVALFMLIFGAGDFGARIVSVIFGLATIVLAFFIGREFGKGEEGRVIGLVGALLTAVLYFEVLYSRQARFYQMFQFLFFFTLFFLYKSKDDKKWAWMACVSLVLLLDTHVEGLVILPIMFYIFWMEQRDWKLLIAFAQEPLPR